MPYSTLRQHVAALNSAYVLGGELIGATLLLLDLRAWLLARRTKRATDAA